MDIYPILDGSFFGEGLDIYSYLDALREAGVGMLQVRLKGFDDRRIFDILNIVRDYLGGEGIKIIVDDRVDMCLACGCDGVHLGESDLPPDVARKILGEKKIIGYSPKSFESADRYLKYVNYFGIGSVFPTISKNKVKVIGIEGLKKYIERYGRFVKIYAIGGIGFNNLHLLKNTGVHGISFISLWKDNPYRSLKKLKEILGKL